MSEPPRTPDRSVLGESWVVASTASLKESTDDRAPASPTPLPRERSKNQARAPASESLTSSTSSWTSGPELIMPSIYEVPISEASWVAPHLRSKTQTGNSTTKKRRKLGSGEAKSQREPQASPAAASPGAGSPASTLPSNRRSTVAKFTSFCHDQSSLIRVALNGLLLALILHLLVLPEFIYQVQDLCRLPTVNALYPDSCVPLDIRSPPRNLFSSNPVVSPEETISASQKSLESIFDSTLQTLVPLAHTLKESENMLGDLHDQLHASFPNVRHALDLEFQGGNDAVRAASWEFDSMRADLHSAIESLIASPPTPEVGGSVARDVRLAVQLRRRAEYLDRLRAQIRTKAESLSSHFNTLDDHLEAVDGIVVREESRASLMGARPGANPERDDDRRQGVWQSLASYAPFGAQLFGPRSSSESSAPGPSSVGGGHPRPATTLALLRLVATHHRPVADSVLRLSRQLRDVQRAGLGGPPS
ncbi:hypothetical protein N7492_007400 [Penicillium capsulatum]|uniref:Uncharacterized protein n=1 Tax=Penicillium capsulatum TaxID=69766 RepID=A0A9W9HZS6_9EURO|nr:hypothetical protein N7492_007400 [Penicillium capsulatum]KAJ6117238.1 hypothetical protein N7512_006963 [Penicillium capsulatum]